MDRRGIKTTLILLLAVTDLFLAGLWIVREQRIAARQRDVNALLLAVLAEAGLEAEAALIPESTAAVVDFRRSPEAEAAAAAVLLGACESETMGGGITEYRSPAGTARFRGMGEFQVTLTQARVLVDDTETAIGNLLRDMGLWQEDARPRLEREENGYALRGQSWGYPLWGGYVSFALNEENALTEVNGRWLLGGGYTELDVVSRTAGWALLSLAEEQDGKGRLLEMEMGYRLSAYSQDVTRLVPCWRVAAVYGSQEREMYLNAVTGTAETPQS